MLPEECRALVQDEPLLRSFAGRERRLAVLRGAFATVFHGRRLLRSPRLAGVTSARAPSAEVS